MLGFYRILTRNEELISSHIVTRNPGSLFIGSSNKLHNIVGLLIIKAPSL